MVSFLKVFKPIILLHISKPTSFLSNTTRFISHTFPNFAIQDNISSLQLKTRTVRKKQRSSDEVLNCEPGLFNVVAYATAEEYNLEALALGLKEQELYEPDKIENNPNVVHAVAKYQVNSEPREIFFFREGSIVLWNIGDLEGGNVLRFLKKYEQDSYTDNLIQGECELMNYKYQDEGYMFSYLIIVF